jgi:hypothetical protein
MTSVLTVSEKIKNDLYPSVVSGVLAAGLFSVVYGESLGTPIPFLGGMEIPAGVVIGASVAAGHLVGNILEDNVLSMLKSDKVSAIGNLVKPALAGLGTYGTLKVLVGGDISFTESMLLGTSSVFGGEYLYNNVLKKY